MKPKTLRIPVCLAFVAILALVAWISPPVDAQVTANTTGTLTSVDTGVATNGVATVTSSSVDVPHGRALAFVPEFKLAGAGTGNVVFTFQVTIDGTDWTTSSGLSHTVAANGTTTVRSLYLLDPTELAAVKAIRLSQISNAANAVVLTNIVVKWSKAAAP